MEIRSCKSCGRLFNYIGGPYICQECSKKLEVKFQEVREYVREHPDAPIATVSQEMDVSVKQIKQWVREERLEFSAESQMGLACEGCGKMIRTGRFCEDCKSKMASEMESVKPKKIMPAPQKKQRDGNKMRFLDK
ncbi:MAG: flagellar protein [Lachnospiraceae bacterium]